jgi:hypothetical protein
MRLVRFLGCTVEEVIFICRKLRENTANVTISRAIVLKGNSVEDRNVVNVCVVNVRAK